MNRRRIMTAEKQKDFIIMTNTSNPAAMSVMKSKTYAASNVEMWLSEALEIINFTGFANNTNLTNFEEFRYFQNCTEIQGRTFKGASNLTKIVLPQSVTNLGYETFNGCSSLTELTIPPKVTTVQPAYYLSGCSQLKKMTILSPASINWLQSLENVVETVIFGPLVTKLNARLFKNFTNVRDIQYTTSLTTIEYEVFANFNFQYIQTFEIADTITTIGNYAFSNCLNLTNLILKSCDPSQYHVNMFGTSTTEACPENIYVPDEALNIYRGKQWSNTNIRNKIKPISQFSN